MLGFPVTELIGNRDYPGSSHFFDIGNRNLLALVDFPGLDVVPYAEVLGGLHHMAISVDPDGARIELIAGPLGEGYGQTVLYRGSTRSRRQGCRDVLDRHADACKQL